MQEWQDERVNGVVFEETPDDVGRFIAVEQGGENFQTIIGRAPAEQVDVVLPAVCNKLDVCFLIVPVCSETEVSE